MKKKLISLSTALLLALMSFTGCQKTTEELIPENDLQDQAFTKTNDGDNNCRLRHVNQGFGFAGPDMDFHYNHKGLADIWRLDYGGGDYEEHQIKYDNKNRIKSTHIVAPVFIPGDAINYTFYSNGNLTTRALGYLESGGIWADIHYMYNKKGQMIKEDDDINGYHSRFYYDNKGFNTKTEFFIGTDLIFISLLKFDIPNRNPYLTVNGVNYGFPSFMWPLFDKRFNSAGSTIMYDEGDPVVIWEDDPAQTVMQTGNAHNLINAHYYEKVSETPYDITFTYQNCNGNDEDNFNNTIPPSFVKKAGPVSIKNALNKILSRHSKNMKQELQELKREYLYKNKAKQK